MHLFVYKHEQIQFLLKFLANLLIIETMFGVVRFLWPGLLIWTDTHIQISNFIGAILKMCFFNLRGVEKWNFNNFIIN